MKKRPYISPYAEIIHLQAEKDIADLVIAVSGTTTPEESDGKGTSFDDDGDDNGNFNNPPFINAWERDL